MLKVEQASKFFGKFIVFENVSISVNPGSIYGLVGINGAGKSTLLRCIAGVYNLNEGQILFEEKKVYENPKVKQDIFFLPDEPFYSQTATPLSIAKMYKSYYPKMDLRMFDELMNKFKVEKKKKIINFSKGMKRKVYVAIALAIKPKLLLLDEAFDGLDPLARNQLKEILIDLVEQEKMEVIISSHSLRELEDLCDSFGILNDKKIISGGNLDQINSNYYKAQIAFNKPAEKSMFSELNYITIDINSKFVTIVCKGKFDEDLEKINKLNPVLVEEVNFNFEDFFISILQREE